MKIFDRHLGGKNNLKKYHQRAFSVYGDHFSVVESFVEGDVF